MVRLMLSLTLHTAIRGHLTCGAHHFGEVSREFHSALKATRSASMAMQGLVAACFAAILGDVAHIAMVHSFARERATREALDAVWSVLFPVGLAALVAAIVGPSACAHSLDCAIDLHAVVAHAHFGPRSNSVAIQLAQRLSSVEIAHNVDRLGMVVTIGSFVNAQRLLEERDGKGYLLDAPIRGA